MRLIAGIFLFLIITSVQSAPDGRRLFATHCSACHGADGDGGVGVPLALPSFLDSVDDAFLARTIRHGRPGRVMPSFKKLSDVQIDAIVAYMRSWSKKPAPTYAKATIKGDAQHGKVLFAEYCASCHGENGEGGKGTGVTFSRKRDLPIIAPALNNSGFLTAASDEMIRKTLQLGREGTPMRSFLVQGLSERDIDDIVSYVRSFEHSERTGLAAGEVTQEKIIQVESSYSLDETVENVKDAIISQNFILIRTDTLEHGLVEEDKENPHQVILHFCNFKFLFDALAIDPRVGMFLPCRVTVTETDSGVVVSTINPKYLGHLFNNAELDVYCSKMYDVYSAILEDATL